MKGIKSPCSSRLIARLDRIGVASLLITIACSLAQPDAAWQVKSSAVFESPAECQPPFGYRVMHTGLAESQLGGWALYQQGILDPLRPSIILADPRTPQYDPHHYYEVFDGDRINDIVLRVCNDRGGNHVYMPDYIQPIMASAILH